MLDNCVLFLGLILGYMVLYCEREVGNINRNVLKQMLNHKTPVNPQFALKS